MATYALPSLIISIILLCIPYQEVVVTAIDSQSTRKHAQLTTEDSTTILKESKPKFVVCYFASWATQRSDVAKFEPKKIDTNICTHINYAFASLSNETLTMVSGEPHIDIAQHVYEHTVKLKKENEKLKVLLSLGGWKDSEGDKYSRMVSEPQSRSKFVKEAVVFLKKYKFDGLDLDWEYPVCWQTRCEIGDPNDKANFVHLVQELREAFDKLSPPLLLTVALGGSKWTARKSYDIADLTEYVDFFNVMSYNLHGTWETKTGHAAEMYSHGVSGVEDHSSVAIMKYYVEQGSPPEKLMMGIPLYGRSFTLANPNNNGMDAPITGAGRHSIHLEEAGVLAYYEICNLITHSGWTVRRDQAAGPYAFRDDQWVGYDDQISAKEKALHILKEGYGGAMVWDLSTDDFNGKCYKRKFPIVRELNMILRPDSIKNKAISSSAIMECKEIILWIASLMFLHELTNF